MTDLVTYLLEQVAANRLSEDAAAELLMQVHASSVHGDVLHPLVHRNTSDLAAQRFTSTFTGDEPWLADHVVHGRRVLPAAALLEMARAAVELAAGEPEPDVAIRLEHVVFLRPLAVEDGPLDVDVTLEASDDGDIAFTIESGGVPHTRGRAVLAEVHPTGVVDMESLFGDEESSISGEECYSELQRLGLVHGPAFQSLELLRVCGERLLGELRMPAGAADPRLVLHPSLLDGAFQTAIAPSVVAPEAGATRVALPFEIERVELLAPLPERVFVVASKQASDFDLVDEEGRRCVAVRGFTRRAPEAAGQHMLLLAPSWVEEPAPLPAAATRRQIVVLCGAVRGSETAILARQPLAQCIRIEPRAQGAGRGGQEPEPRGQGAGGRGQEPEVSAPDSAPAPTPAPCALPPAPSAAPCALPPAPSYASAAKQLLERLKELLPDPRQTLVQLVVPASGPDATLRGLAALVRSAGRETGRISTQLVLVSDDHDDAALARLLAAEAVDPDARDVRYISGRRTVSRFEERTDFGAALQPWRDGGTYLITGGAGGLGFVFAEAIATDAPGARVVLVGRSPLDETRQAQLDRLRARGVQAEYRAVDVSDASEVAELVAGLDHLRGVIHAAGVLRDGFAATKSAADLDAVFAPKVHGLVALDEATAHLPLDWFVVCSSVTAVTGNVGQADYAAANGFLDAYCESRNALVASGRRHGRMVSVNWPLWATGGMHVDATAAERMRRSGLAPLSSENGIAALRRALGGSDDRLMVLAGDPVALRRSFLGGVPRGSSGSSELLGVVRPGTTRNASDRGTPLDAATPRNSEELRGTPRNFELPEQTCQYLTSVIAQNLGLPAARIAPDARIDEYGLDSVRMMELIGLLEKTFGPLPATLFFEHHTVERLTAWFVENHAATLEALFGGAADDAPAEPPAVEQKPAAVARPRKRFAPRREAQDDGAPSRDIAIIGVSGRYPKARTLDEYWSNLLNGVDCITEVPRDRWDHARYFDGQPQTPGKTYGRWGGFIDGVDRFDPLFFNIPPRNAAWMDPQERLFLECAYGAIEDAGYARESLAGASVGVFVGVMYQEYQLYGAQAQAQGDGYAIQGNPSTIANRVSFWFDLHGPSLSIDTMCSSSLTAIHLAIQSIERGECGLAIAGGVNLTVHPNKFLALALGQFLSTDGRCRSFGSGGDGYVPGEGVGAVLLKPLAAAEADGDPIYGVIKGTAVNHGGHASGYTVPNPQAQAEVIQRALERAGVSPRAVSYIEAHGTGTSLGDPIEIAGLVKAFGTGEKQFCAIGSVKSNIGHCESAAGIAGLTKVLLQMRHRTLAPSLHAQELNPHIDFSGTPFVVQRTATPWQASPRIAGVSSFGAGGTNAHVIVAEYEPAPRPVPAGPVVLVLSARSEERLRRRVEQLLAVLDSDTRPELAEIAWTLQTGREPMEARLACVAASASEAKEKLGAWLRGDSSIDGLYTGEAKRGAGAVPRSSSGSSGFLGVNPSGPSEELRGTPRNPEELNLPRIGELWTRGAAIPWATLYGGMTPRRVSLPTYPFAGERYWVPTLAASATEPIETEETAMPLAAPASEVVASLVWEPFAPAASPAPFAGEIAVIGGTPEQLAAIPGARALAVSAASSEEEIAAELRAIDAGQIVWIVPSPADVPLASDAQLAAQAAGSRLGLRLIKALAAAGYAAKPLALTVITERAQAVRAGERVVPAHASVHGLMGSAAKEYASWQVRLIDAAGDSPLASLLGVTGVRSGATVAYRDGEWFRPRWARCVLPAAAEPRMRGVWVVIGGAGGVGEVFSEHAIARYGAQVVWIGRRPLDATIIAKQDRLAARGPRPHYIAADASDRAALTAAREEILARFGAIHGLVVSVAGPLDDSLARVSEESFGAGLAAKADVSVRAAQVFGTDTLDFALFFSSLGAFERSGGQASYAAGCVFQDTYARALAAEWACPVRIVNWGYWGDVGIGNAIPQAFRTRLRQSGNAPIDPAAAMAAVERLLASPIPQVVYFAASSADAPAVAALDLLAEEEVTIAPSAPAILPELPASTVPPPPVDREALARGEALDRLLAKLLFVQMQSAGLLDAASPARAALPPLYERWLEHSLRFMEPVSDPAAVWAEWEALQADAATDSARRSRAALLDATVRALPDILQGRRIATDVIFPNASLHLVSGIYTKNIAADYCNAVVVDTLVAYVAARVRRDPAARLRLIEIGSGTGGTSAAIFPALRPYADHIAEYCYTDISPAFLLHGEKQYRAIAPYLTTKRFDVEQPLGPQGIEAGAYDAVIATNVLHATHDMRRTMRQTKAVLKANGIVLINEMTATSIFLHLTFGLLPGWWAFTDDALRVPGSPSLSAETWERLLLGDGFTAFRRQSEEFAAFAQQVFVAQSDGAIRQPAIAVERVEPLPAPVARPKASPAEHRVAAPLDESALRDRVAGYVRKLVAQTLNMTPQQLDPTEPLETYGIDSILVQRITHGLSEAFGPVSKIALFEHQTIDALAEHLLAVHRDAAVRMFGGTRSSSVPRSSSGSSEGPRLITPRNSEEPEAPEEPARRGRRDIAIVGLSGRYPKAPTLDLFWERLRGGESCVTEVPASRWDWRERYGSEKGRWGTIYSKWGGFIDDVDCFDPLFFNISPREALNIDPQERIFLEESYACIADAGYTPASLSPSRQVGVFAGVTNGAYRQRPLYWSIPNRVSATFGFHGPSIAVDTACSGSLTAIHLACEQLASGRIDCALAGGVNVIADAIQYVRLSAMMMLTSGDACRTFGADADGFVDAEGVGVVLLKPLSRAIADGDHIYGVIKASAVNHGGKASGYTTPNPNAQAELIARALGDAGVPARAISYVEAHGTGTALGDPIEISGLVKAFAADTRETQFCAIGSVKSNIGHCESAAGIAGLTKVLLQLKHRTLVPSLHSATPNPNIDFAATPFVVQQTTAPWRRPVVREQGVAREYPRIAGLSSFGAGGSNAHLVIEEYVDAQPASTSTGEPAVIVLSAKSEPALRESAERLLAALDRSTGLSLRDVAWTLQAGREAMESRLACVVESLDELRAALRAYLAGQPPLVPFSTCADTAQHRNALDALGPDDDVAALIQAWVAKGKWAKLADLWTIGLTIDWEALQYEPKPRRVSLPAYPFARERYWEPFLDAPVAASHGGRLHPLVHENTSTLDEQRFTSRFTGDEFFFRDHVVQGERILPAAAHLEMARAAAALAASRGTVTEQASLENVVFVRPIAIADGPLELHVVLEPAEGGAIAFTICGEDEVVYSRGLVRFASVAPAVVDLHAIEARCTDEAIDGAACYARFADLGLAYGPSFRALERLLIGREQSLVAAALALPAGASSEAFVLHPSLLDAALQAALGLADGKGQAGLPFEIERVDVLAVPPSQARAVVRRTGRGLDVELTDVAGRVCVRVTGFRTRAVAGRSENEALTLVPVWERIEAGPAVQVPTLVIGDGQPVALDPSDTIEVVERKLRAAGEVDRILWIVGQEASRLGLRLVKALIAAGYGTKPLQLTAITRQTQAVHAGERVLPSQASVHGLFGSAAKEYSSWQVRIVDAGAEEWEAEAMFAVPEVRSGATVAYRNGAWFGQRWERCELEPASSPLYRRGGVYVILGGAGGLGEAFSEHLIASYAAQVVWIGRRAPDAEIAAKQDRLAAMGPRPHYIAADATDRAALVAARGEIVALFGEIHGLVHATIVLNDQGLARMDEAAFAAAASAKIDVAENMAAVFQHDAPDFVLFFSALQSALRVAGQSNYAAGCTFVDAYADALRQSWRCAVKVVNWGYWGSTGIVAAGDYPSRMAQFGLASIDPRAALEMVDRLLASTTDRVAYLNTTGPDAPVLRALELTGRSASHEEIGSVLPSTGRRDAARPAGGTPALRETPALQERPSLASHVRRAIRESITEAVRVAPERIRDDQAFSDYGVDSIVAVSLVNTINTRLGLTLNTTVLFDYGSVAQLVDHIVRTHGSEVSAMLAPERSAGVSPAGVAASRAATWAGGGARHEEIGSVLPSTGRRDAARAAGETPALRQQPALPVRKRFREVAAPVAVAADGPRYQRVVIDGPGSIDDLRLVQGALPPLGDDDVLIAVHAFSLNFADVLCVSGLYPHMPAYPFTPGAEVSGTVVAVGRAVTKVAVGNSVIAMAGPAMGAHATALVAPAGHVFKMPASLSFEEACALPAVALTAIAAFHKIRPSRGERILIQTATGGTGLAMLQLARHHGLEIFATAGSEAKLEYLRSLGVTNVINYVACDFEAEVRRLTGGAGVDIVVNTLPGDALQKGLHCLAPGGRYLEIAMAALKSARSVDLTALDANQTFLSLDLRKLLSDQPGLLAAYWNELVALVGDGVLTPVIGRTFPLPAVADAYRWMSDRAHIGKVVVQVPEESRFELAAAPAHPRVESRPGHDRIAIVGMSGRFGSAADLEQLWAALAAGEELIEEPTRWTLPPQNPDEPPRCRRGGFLRDIDRFDALFFNISGVEATHTDPQQRLFLEEAWKAVEDAGYAGTAIEGARCGVYVGCAAGDYVQLLDETRPPQAFWGNAGSVIPARIAYHLDLHGPAVAVDTACSSSLVALHLACQALRAREVDIALAGGVFVQCTPGFFGLANHAGMLSPTGHCYAFDARADGFVPGEGVGVVVLKRLADAEADGDHIYGVIRGSGTNQDGTTNGITAPSGRSQERLEREVYETFSIHPEDLQYVEAHGTGTKLGDPIEFRALTRAFAKDTAKTKFCGIGSIKSNIGHTANAAGIAGVMKVLLALQHRQLPPTLNYEQGNPEIDFENSALRVCTELEPWEAAPGRKRCAAVSSFGISGTNAHVVIEEAPVRTAVASTRPAHLIVLSARSADGLRRQAERLVAHCRTHEVSCADASYTLLAGRRHFAHRLACVARDADDLVASLTAWLNGGRASMVRTGIAKDDPAPMRETDLLRLAELYVDGHAVDLEALFAGQQTRRVSLPTYPFADDRYWVRTRRAEIHLAPRLEIKAEPPRDPDEIGDEYLDAFRDGLIDLDAMKALIDQGIVR
ncbi:MAG TPA: SDR family NAD(P)-dependent oxidoreductase [Thermoanaerobaculia bacterium]